MMLGRISFTGRSGTFASSGSFTVDDANRTTNTDVLTLTHTTTDALFGGNSMGTGILFRLENSVGDVENSGRVSSFWVDSTDASEDSGFSFLMRTAGAALTERVRFTERGRVLADGTDPDAVSDAIANFGFIGDTDTGLIWTSSDLVSLWAGNSLASGGGGVSVSPLFTAVTAVDAVTNSISDSFEIDHFTSGAATAGYGTAILFVGEDAGGGVDNMGRLAFVWLDATATSEDSNLQIHLRQGGAALANRWELFGDGSITSALSTSLTVSMFDVWTLNHSTSGVAGAAFGTAFLFRGEDAGGTVENMGRLGFRWTDASAASEDSEMVVQLRRAGAALASNLVLTNAQLAVTVGGGAVLGSAGVAEFSTADVDGRVFARSSNANGFGGLVGQNDSGYQMVAACFGSGLGGTRFGVNLANSVQIYAIDPGAAAAVSLAVGSFGAGSVVLGTANTKRLEFTGTGQLGFFGVAPVARAAAYTPTNVTTDRSYDADTVVVAELADVVGTLIADLQAYGLLQ